MMKQINIPLFGLFVLVIFPRLSVALPPMFRGEGSSSSSALEPSPPQPYELEFFVQGQSTGTTVYIDSFIVLRVYDDRTRLEYNLTAWNGDDVFANSARNTDVVFKLNNRMKIREKDNDAVSYSLEFKRIFDAYVVCYHLISAESAQYKKCKGSNSYKLQKLYKNGTEGYLVDMGENWCIFKIHKTNMTTFMIKWLSEMEDYRDVTCIFPSTDYSLTPFPEANNKFELAISFGGEFLEPKYVLKTPTPDKIQEFFNSA